MYRRLTIRIYSVNPVSTEAGPVEDLPETTQLTGYLLLFYYRVTE